LLWDLLGKTLLLLLGRHHALLLLLLLLLLSTILWHHRTLAMGGDVWEVGVVLLLLRMLHLTLHHTLLDQTSSTFGSHVRSIPAAVVTTVRSLALWIV
jgi:hypothetical protein